MATASPYCTCTHRFVNTQTDTPSQMKVARCRAKSCLRMSMSLQPLKQGSRWPTVVLKLWRNRGSTEQCFICAHWAVAALCHGKFTPTENTSVHPSCPGVHSGSIKQYLSHYYIWRPWVLFCLGEIDFFKNCPETKNIIIKASYSFFYMLNLTVFVLT